ncbi:MAG: TetR/AcrR family transcriptional regulator [Boseongicola sp.]|nr:TetR/AcrR family transcriptional regulator [Boseongicola sp.]
MAPERAADVFMAKGHEATSMARLPKGMGINKGSSYNAFGSKKELFKQVLTMFVRDNQGPLLARLFGKRPTPNPARIRSRARRSCDVRYVTLGRTFCPDRSCPKTLRYPQCLRAMKGRSCSTVSGAGFGSARR